MEMLQEDYLFKKKIEMMIDTNNKRLSNELSSIKSIISKLNEDINELKKERKESNGIKAQEERESKANENNQKSSKEPLKPRCGDYKPEDVSINKFFYFGNK